MAKRVIPWAAEIRTFLAVVELIAHDAIRKAQLALLSEMHVLGPVLADSESSFGGQTADHVVNILLSKSNGIFVKYRSSRNNEIFCKLLKQVRRIPVDWSEDSAFQASIISETIPCNDGKLVKCSL